MHPLRLYGVYLDHSLRQQMQYRANMLLRIGSQCLITGVEFLGIWALFDRFGTLPGWGLAEVAVLYGIVQVGFGLSAMFGRSFDTFGGMLRRGEFDRLLLRPRGTLLQLFGAQCCLRRIGNLLQGGAVLGWGLSQVALVEAWWSWPMLVVTVLGCGSFFLSLWILQATSCFWTTEGMEAWNVLTHGGNTLASYPLTCYQPWLQRLVTWVLPIALVTYFPTLVLLDRSDSLWHALAPLSGGVTLLLAMAAWRLGLRRHASTGS